MLITTSSCEAQSFWELGRPLYQFFSTRDYGGDNQNWSTIQDREGLLFFGNNSFVLDYDGQRWGHVAVPGGFAIRGLAVDASGAIWVGGAGKLGHLVSNGGRYQFQPAKADVHLPSPLGEVLDIVPCVNAEYVRTEKALLVYQNGSWDTIPWPHGNGLDYIVAATAKRIFVHAKSEPLYEIIDGRLVALVDDPRLRTTVVYQVVEPVSGTILLLTKEHGIFRLEQNGIEPFRTDIDPLLARYAIQWATCLPGPYIAVAIDQHGVAVLDRAGRLKNVLFQDSGLPDPNILSLGSDRSGGLWICGNAGLTRLEIRPGISFFDVQNGLPRSAVYNLKRFRGQLYAATWDGLYGLEKATAETLPSRFRKIPGPATPIPALIDAGTELLAGGWKGLFSFDGLQLRQIPVPIDRVYSLRLSKAIPGRVYVASNQGLATLSKTSDGWRLDGILDQFGGAVTDVIEGDSDQLFVSTLNHGFFRVNLQSGSSRIFDGASVLSLAQARNAPQVSESDALIRINGEPAFISEDGIAWYDAAESRFVPVAGFGTLFRDYVPRRAIVSPGDTKEYWISLTPRINLGRQRSNDENRTP